MQNDNFKPLISAHPRAHSIKNLLRVVCLLAALAPCSALAQETPRAEIFGGYSFLNFRSEGEGVNGHGFTVSVAGNLNKNVGLVGEFGRQSASERINLRDFFGDPTLPNVTIEAKASLATYVFGPRFYARSDRITGFAHALAGGARGRGEASASGVSGGLSDTGFALTLGGGIDINAGKYIAIRVGQFDYLLTRVFDGSQHNFKYSAGLVFKLGSR